MGLMTAIAVGGIAIAGAGAIGQNKARKEASQASKQAEELRRKEMELENRRRMTQLIRSAAIARARSIASASAAGATFSSLAEGGLGSIQSQAGANVEAQATNVSLGRQMFEANANLAEAQGEAAVWSSVTDFGKTLFANSEPISNIGKTLFTGSK